MPDLFGASTRVEQVRELMIATPELGTGIRFTRTVDGTLKTDPHWRSDFLDE